MVLWQSKKSKHSSALHALSVPDAREIIQLGLLREQQEDISDRVLRMFSIGWSCCGLVLTISRCCLIMTHHDTYTKAIMMQFSFYYASLEDFSIQKMQLERTQSRAARPLTKRHMVWSTLQLLLAKHSPLRQEKTIWLTREVIDHSLFFFYVLFIDEFI